MEIEQFYKNQLVFIEGLKKLGYTYWDFQDHARGRRFSIDKDSPVIILPSYPDTCLTFEYKNSNPWFVYSVALMDCSKIQEQLDKVSKIKEILDSK